MRLSLPSPVLTRPNGFSIIELVVTLGVVLILVGVTLPAIQGSAVAARTTADGASLRQAAVLIITYTTDHKDVFPIARDHAHLNTLYWPEALARAGTIAHAENVDPWASERSFENRFWLSACMAADPSLFTRRRESSTFPVRGIFLREVVFPSEKGLALRMNDGYSQETNDRGNWFCCTDRWQTPVTFVDGSVRVGDWMDFIPPGPFESLGMAGTPVIGTWDGVRGRDLFQE